MTRPGAYELQLAADELAVQAARYRCDALDEEFLQPSDLVQELRARARRLESVSAWLESLIAEAIS